MVVNYPSPDVEFTRIVEYKHVPNQPQAVKDGKVKGTLIAKETSSDVGDPYYPVPNPKNNELYEKYGAPASTSPARAPIPFILMSLPSLPLTSLNHPDHVAHPTHASAPSTLTSPNHPTHEPQPLPLLTGIARSPRRSPAWRLSAASRRTSTSTWTRPS